MDPPKLGETCRCCYRINRNCPRCGEVMDQVQHEALRFSVVIWKGWNCKQCRMTFNLDGTVLQPFGT